MAFRFRAPIFALLHLLGFLLPRAWDAGNGTLWLTSSRFVAEAARVDLAIATAAVTFCALALLAMGTVLRVWATAFVGSGVMRGSTMQADLFIRGGPYRYLRNPLYLGSWLLAAGVSILMPPAGAAFFLPAFSLFVLFLVFAEEHFLSQTMGDAYQQYRRRVPRLWPRLRSGPDGGGRRPRWMQAVVAEIYAVAFTMCFATYAWRYNAHILVRCLLISYGLSLVARALRPADQSQPSTDPVKKA